MLSPLSHSGRAQRALKRRSSALSIYLNCCGLPRGRRPGRALIRLRHRSQTFVGELLDALSFVGLGRIDVAPRIGRDVVHAMPLTWLAAAFAERRQDVERLAPQDVNERVLAVGDV